MVNGIGGTRSERRSNRDAGWLKCYPQVFSISSMFAMHIGADHMVAVLRAVTTDTELQQEDNVRQVAEATQVRLVLGESFHNSVCSGSVSRTFRFRWETITVTRE